MAKGKFPIVNISDCLNNRIEGIGWLELKRLLSAFYSIDPNVEAFLKNSAEEFARQHKSVTHLVFSNDLAKLVGYFTLAIKPITVRDERMSKTMARAFKKVGKFDEVQNTYTVAAYLIGQLGRNFSPSLKANISGDELLDVALKRLKGIQRNVGGTIVFLEAQNNEKLLSFYQGNGFRALDSRIATYKDGSALELVQLFKVL